MLGNMKAKMRIVPYKELTKLQQDIASSAGDKDGGCPWKFIIEYLTDRRYTDQPYKKLEVKKELVNMIKTGILVGSAYGPGNLHYPGMRPNESRQVFEENTEGYEDYKTKTVNVPDYPYQKEVYIVTDPAGKETECVKLSEIMDVTGLPARVTSQAMRGLADASPYKIKRSVVNKIQKGGPRKIEVKVFVKPPKKPFDYEKEILGKRKGG